MAVRRGLSADRWAVPPERAQVLQDLGRVEILTHSWIKRPARRNEISGNGIFGSFCERKGFPLSNRSVHSWRRLCSLLGVLFASGGFALLSVLGSAPAAAPVLAAAHANGGYVMVAKDGGIFTFGDAGFHGSTGNVKLNSPIVGLSSTPTHDGYWLVAADGGIFTFGDAGFHGST